MDYRSKYTFVNNTAAPKIVERKLFNYREVHPFERRSSPVQDKKDLSLNKFTQRMFLNAKKNAEKNSK